MKRKFSVDIERDSEGWLVASVPSLPGCHTQTRSFLEIESRIHEAISLFTDEINTTPPHLRFKFHA